MIGIRQSEQMARLIKVSEYDLWSGIKRDSAMVLCSCRDECADDDNVRRWRWR